MSGVVLALALLVLQASALAAQRLAVGGDLHHPAAAGIARVVERDIYRVLDRDTILPASFIHAGDLVIVDALVRLEGTVTGTVAVVGGSFFLRPGARVDGPIVSAAAIVGTSRLATTGDTVALPTEYGVTVTQEGGLYTVEIRNPRRPPLLAPDGLFGVLRPSYDRVNGATVGIGIEGNLSADSARTRYRISGNYYSARGTLGGTAELRTPLAGRGYLSIRGGRESVTRDDWIRGDLSNSLSTLFVRSDVRNYYEADHVGVALAEEPPGYLQPGGTYWAPRLVLTVSRDRSVEASDPWTLFGDDPWRPNPPVFEETLTTAALGVSTGWQGVSTSVDMDADLEWAFPSPTGLSWGKREFLQVTGDARWEMLAMWNHSLSVRAHVMQNLGSEQAPPQRWSILGGAGTLPALNQGELRGDNVVFIQSIYAIPLAFVAVPIFGIPEIAVRHAVGSAWLSDEGSPRWHQNVGLGLRVRVAELFVDLDPAAADPDPHLNVGFRLPLR